MALRYAPPMELLRHLYEQCFPMHAFGLRELTWRDRLYWERVGSGLAGAAIAIGLVLWIAWPVSGDELPIVLFFALVGATIGFPLAICSRDFEREVARWPRRDDQAITVSPSRGRSRQPATRPDCGCGAPRSGPDGPTPPRA